MVGYLLNNKDQELHGWRQLFHKKCQLLEMSDKEYFLWNRITKIGLPKDNNECWKHPTFKNLLKFHFITHDDKMNILSKPQIEKLSFSIDSHRLVFFDGHFLPTLSDINIKPWLLQIDRNPDFSKIINDFNSSEIFSNLTDYLSNEIVHIILPKQHIAKKPLYLIYINRGSNIPNSLVTSHYFHYLRIEDDAHAVIIEHFINIDENSYFINTHIPISIGDRAKLQHTKLIFENRFSHHISYHDVIVGKSSILHSNIFSIYGPKFLYHKTKAKLNAADSSIILNSLMFLLEKDVGAIHTFLEHNNQGHSLSRQIHKIIACDCSLGIFNGLIKVQHNSTETDGKMVNNNLLLHESAKISTNPKLEIYSDSVKCSHGATTGQINIEQLFYLEIRGISKKNALNMLIHAFSIEVTTKIKNPVLEKIVLNRINQALIRSNI